MTILCSWKSRSLLSERHVQACEYGELRYAIPRTSHRILRFDIRVENGGAALPGFAAAQAKRDVIGAVLKVERPDTRGTHVPSLRKIEDAEWFAVSDCTS